MESLGRLVTFLNTVVLSSWRESLQQARTAMHRWRMMVQLVRFSSQLHVNITDMLGHAMASLPVWLLMSITRC